ncbi:MAG: GNAT family N-acetyltransferase [Undibacterium sp.]|nr:GNAT family N-acetyltransferase [Opitutaceae bacterium]
METRENGLRQGGKLKIGPVIREFSSSDDGVALTELLHRAYAVRAAAGLKFTATYQAPEHTLRRISKGRCFVVEDDGKIVGTLCLFFPESDSPVEFYRDPSTCHFGRYGVEPACKGRGIGRALHDHIVNHAAALGGTRMALDTAAPAADLVAMYGRWGYAEAGRFQRGQVNDESVIMARGIGARVG